jgi:hypothetical protein
VVRKVSRATPHLLLVLVRPGEGTWARSAVDSGPDDSDFAPDGRMTFSIDRLEPLEGTASSPLSLRAHDVVVAADLRALTATILELGN